MSIDNDSNKIRESLSPLRQAQLKKNEVTGKITGHVRAIHGNSSPTTGGSFSPSRIVQPMKDQVTGKITDQVVGLFSNKNHFVDPTQRISPVNSPSVSRTHREKSLLSMPARGQQSQIDELESIRSSIKGYESSVDSESVEDARSKKERLERISTGLDQAISKLEQLSPGSKELADAYVLSGKLSEKQIKYDEALKKCALAISLYEQNQIEEIKYASILVKMGMLCQGLDKVDEAMVHLKKAKQIYESHSKITTLTADQAQNFVDTHGQIANLLLENGCHPRDTLIHHQDRYKIYKTTNSNGIDLARCCDQIALISTQESGAYYGESLSIEEGLSITDRDLVFARIQKIYELYEKSKEAGSILGRANQNLVYDVFSASASLVTRTRTNKISMQLRSSVKQYETTLEAKRKIKPGSTFVAASFEHIGDIYKDLRKVANSIEPYLKAYEIYAKSLPSGHPTLVALLDKLRAAQAEVKGEPSIARAAVSMSMARDHSVIRAQSISSADTLDGLLKNLQDDPNDPMIGALREKIKELMEKNMAKQAADQSSRLKKLHSGDSLTKLLGDLEIYKSGSFFKNDQKDAANLQLKELLLDVITKKEGAREELSKFVWSKINNNENFQKNGLFSGTFTTNLWQNFIRAVSLVEFSS